MYSKHKSNYTIDIYYFRFAIILTLVPLFLIIQMLLLPQINVIHLDQLLQKNSFISNYLNFYPVIVEHKTFTKPKTGQIPVYSSITSGGSGGITKDFGFHTLTNEDELLITYSSSNVAVQDNTTQKQEPSQKILNSQEGLDSFKENKQKDVSKNQDVSKQELPTKIPANYRFRNDFALRWDNSPEFAIASVELKGYKYFRDMLRQIRDNFSPPGLNLVWRDSAGFVISQPIKPQVVRVLFLLDYDGTVRDVKIVSSMGQKPVDEACVRALLYQNFGPPPPEVFEHGNIFGINFIFPPLYQ